MTAAPARRRLVPLAAAVVLVVVPAFLVAARTPAKASEPTVEAQVLSLTNAARTSHGLAPLHSSSALSSIARSWSAHMAAAGSLVHNGSLASQVHGWSMIGENIAMAGSATQAQQLWMGSGGHRANILQPRYNRVGVGVTRSSDGRLWFTVDFEQVSGSAPAPTPTHSASPAPTKHHSSATRPSSQVSRTSAAHRASRSAPRTTRPLRARPPATNPAMLLLPARLAARDAGSDMAYVEAAPARARAAVPDDPPASAPLVAGLAALLAAGALVSARFGRVDVRRLRPPAR